eukprot:1160173-Pelagomonas_calceolata.AAC.1
MTKIRGPRITLLASDHPKTAHSSTLGPVFTPQTIFKQRKEESQRTTLLESQVLDFLEGVARCNRRPAPVIPFKWVIGGSGGEKVKLKPRLIRHTSRKLGQLSLRVSGGSNPPVRITKRLLEPSS